MGRAEMFCGTQSSNDSDWQNTHATTDGGNVMPMSDHQSCTGDCDPETGLTATPTTHTIPASFNQLPQSTRNYFHQQLLPPQNEQLSLMDIVATSVHTQDKTDVGQSCQSFEQQPHHRQYQSQPHQVPRSFTQFCSLWDQQEPQVGAGIFSSNYTARLTHIDDPCPQPIASESAAPRCLWSPTSTIAPDQQQQDQSSISKFNKHGLEGLTPSPTDTLLDTSDPACASTSPSSIVTAVPPLTGKQHDSVFMESIEPNNMMLSFGNDFKCDQQNEYQSNGYSGGVISTSIQHDPPKSYARLLYDCFMSHPDHKMTLQEIYQWFRENTTKACDGAGKGWQNSVRHNLSMNQAFVKQERRADDGSVLENQLISSDSSTSNMVTMKKKTANIWVLADWAIRDGIQSTTRYRSNKNGSNANSSVRKSYYQTPLRGGNNNNNNNNSSSGSGSGSGSRSSHFPYGPRSYPRSLMSPTATRRLSPYPSPQQYRYTSSNYQQQQLQQYPPPPYYSMGFTHQAQFHPQQYAAYTAQSTPHYFSRAPAVTYTLSPGNPTLATT